MIRTPIEWAAKPIQSERSEKERNGFRTWSRQSGEVPDCWRNKRNPYEWSSHLDTLREPSERWPYSYMSGTRTRHHIAALQVEQPAYFTELLEQALLITAHRHAINPAEALIGHLTAFLTAHPEVLTELVRRDVRVGALLLCGTPTEAYARGLLLPAQS